MTVSNTDSSVNVNGNGNGNGAIAVARPFLNGVYCPLITPFEEDTGKVNLGALKKQVVRLADAGMGIVLLGTNGEGELVLCFLCLLSVHPLLQLAFFY